MEPPSENVNYPRGNPNVGPNFGPGAHMDAIQAAWKLVQSNFGTWIVAGLLILVIQYAISFTADIVFALATGSAGSTAYGSTGKITSAAEVFTPLFFMQFGLRVFISTGINGLFSAGFVVFAIDILQGGTADYGKLFSAFKKFGPNFLIACAVGFATTIGMMLCLVPGIYLTGRMNLALTHSVMNPNLTATEALEQAWSTMGPIAWGMAWVTIVAGLASGLGVLACCVGILFTYPVLYIVLAMHYRANFMTQPGFPGGVVDYPR